SSRETDRFRPSQSDGPPPAPRVRRRPTCRKAWPGTGHPVPPGRIRGPRFLPAARGGAPYDTDGSPAARMRTTPGMIAGKQAVVAADPLPALLRHWVPTAGVPGMAARDSAKREKRPPERPVTCDSLPRVLRATRPETTARRTERPEQQLVAADHDDERGGRGPASVMTGA